jgi:hypothetical protein
MVGTFWLDAESRLGYLLLILPARHYDHHAVSVTSVQIYGLSPQQYVDN